MARLGAPTFPSYLFHRPNPPSQESRADDFPMMGEPLEHDPEEILMSVGILGRVGCGQLDTWLPPTHLGSHTTSAPMEIPGDDCARVIERWEEDGRRGKEIPRLGILEMGILGRVSCGQLGTWHTIAHQNSAPMKMPGDNCAREIQQWEEDSRDGD